MSMTVKEAIEKIGTLEEQNCKSCKIRSGFRKEGKPETEILDYCVKKCPIGKRIRAYGGVLEYGKVANSHLKALDLTKEKYIELHDKGMMDKDIIEEYNISRITLSRRKRSWKLNKDKEYTNNQKVLVGFTKEKLLELIEDYTTKEIADMYGVSHMTISKRRKDWGITKEEREIGNRFTIDEYLYLSKTKKMFDKDIAVLWEIAWSSLITLKTDWNLIEKLLTPQDVGLTPEILRKEVPLKTDREIAKDWNLKEVTLTKYRKSLGISYKERLPSFRIKLEDIQPLLDQGLSMSAIARTLEIDRKTLSGILKNKSL